MPWIGLRSANDWSVSGIGGGRRGRQLARHEPARFVRAVAGGPVFGLGAATKGGCILFGGGREGNSQMVYDLELALDDQRSVFPAANRQWFGHGVLRSSKLSIRFPMIVVRSAKAGRPDCSGLSRETLTSARRGFLVATSH